MASIEVDFEVWKELTARRRSEEETYNDVLRSLLKMKKASAASKTAEPTLAPWFAQGVMFPEGTPFRFTHRGEEHRARVENAALVLSNGQRYTSPSAAAGAITGTNINGWRTWECQLPGSDSWILIDTIRRQQGGR